MKMQNVRTLDQPELPYHLLITTLRDALVRLDH